MKLSIEGLKETAQYRAANVQTPGFDVAAMQQRGRSNPRWLHFGPGNIFRVFPARIAAEMIGDDHFWPITGVESYGDDSRRQLTPFDLMTLGVTLHPDGRTDKRVIAGMSECLVTADPADLARLAVVAADPGVTLMSFTITEKGYAISSGGSYLPAVMNVIEAGPNLAAPNAMALVAALLWRRYENGAAALTLLSMDNFSHNGDKLRDSVLQIVSAWAEHGHVPDTFVNWVSDPQQVAFPISVIDKITPRPSASVAAKLGEIGFNDMELDTSGPVALAGFVNTEAPEYLIIEDAFAAGVDRPPFENYGAQVVAREICDKFETMKVTTCLNPLHTALALSGCLLGFETIDAAVADPQLKQLVERLGWVEGMPVVVDPGIIDPAEFLREVINVRLTNPYLPDQPLRIAMDTSQKLAIRFGHTLRSYLAADRPVCDLVAIPLVYALWLRYLTARDDRGEAMQLASDPLLERLQTQLAPLTLGETDTAKIAEIVKPLLADADIFGLDLTATPLAERVIGYLTRMLAAPGAVRAVLRDELATATN